MKKELLTVVSGGQTGVDRAALDAAIAAGVAHDGWCPAGRRAEDGKVPMIYRLNETRSAGYMERTIANIRMSDVTLILYWDRLQGGTGRTRTAAISFRKEYYTVKLDALERATRHDLVQAIAPVLRHRERLILNVAGPRASKSPLVYPAAKKYMDELLRMIAE